MHRHRHGSTSRSMPDFAGFLPKAIEADRGKLPHGNTQPTRRLYPQRAARQCRATAHIVVQRIASFLSPTGSSIPTSSPRRSRSRSLRTIPFTGVRSSFNHEGPRTAFVSEHSARSTERKARVPCTAWIYIRGLCEHRSDTSSASQPGSSAFASFARRVSGQLHTGLARARAQSPPSSPRRDVG